MGLWDWMKRKDTAEIPKEEKKELELPEMDRDAVLEETLNAFADDDEEQIIEIAIEVRPEYDSGTVDTDVLLDETMESNYELNVVDVVDVNEVGDDLENAEIIGDLPEEVEI